MYWATKPENSLQGSWLDKNNNCNYHLIGVLSIVVFSFIFFFKQKCIFIYLVHDFYSFWHILLLKVLCFKTMQLNFLQVIPINEFWCVQNGKTSAFLDLPSWGTLKAKIWNLKMYKYRKSLKSLYVNFI